MFGVSIVVGEQGFELGELGAGQHHRIVRSRQILEVGDERVDPGAGVKGLQHVLAHKAVEVADGFHRHRLME